MVREKILYRLIDDFPIYSEKKVPVCEICVTDQERERQHYKVTCKGCGRLLSFPLQRLGRVASLNGGGHRTARTCSNACFRRALRKRRRPKGHVCAVCREEFTSARKDAKFCSSACRQWAYRLRGMAL